MAEYKFGQGLLEEEKEEEQPLVSDRYVFGQGFPKPQPRPEEESQTRLEKVPSIFKEGLYGFVEGLTKLPGGYLDSVKEQAYSDLRADFSQKLEGDSKRSISDEIFSRGRGLIYDFYRSEIENDIGLKNSFFDSGSLNVALRTKEELEPARQELLKQGKEFRDEIIKETKDYRTKQAKRYQELGFDRTDATAAGVVTSVSLVLPTLAASFLTRSPKIAYASIPLFSGLAYTDSFENGIADGLSTEDAIKNAKIDGLSEGITELGPTKFLSDALSIGMRGNKNKVKEVLTNGAAAFITDTAGEQVNTLIQTTSTAYFDYQDELRVAYDNRNDPFYEGPDYKDLLAENSYYTLLASTLAGGSIVGANSVIALSPEIKAAFASKGREEGGPILDNFNNLVINNSLNKVALDKTAIRLAETNDPRIDPNEVLAEEMLKIEYVGRTEQPQQDQDQELSISDQIENKFEAPVEIERSYAFGKGKQETKEKKPGRLTSEIDFTIQDDAEQRVNDDMAFKLRTIPGGTGIRSAETGVLNLSAIENNLYDDKQLRNVQEYIINSRRFPRSLLTEGNIKFNEEQFYRYRDLNQQESLQISKTTSNLLDAKMPIDIFADLNFVGALTRDNRFRQFTGAYGTYDPSIEGITLAPISGLTDLNYRSDLARNIQLIDTFSHELGHHIDFSIGKLNKNMSKDILSPSTSSSPLFDLPNITVEENTVNVDENSGGPVMRELLNLYLESRNNPDRDYYGGEMLNYPFMELIAIGDKVNISEQRMIKAEVFAQAHTLYYTNRKLLEDRAPATFKLIEDLNNAISVDGSRKQNQEVLRAFQSSDTQRSSQVRGPEDTDVETQQGDIEQTASVGMAEQSGDQTRVDLRPQIPEPRRVGTTGQVVGAPEGIDTTRKLNSLRRKISGLAKEGETGAFWYEESGKAIMDLVDNNVQDADILAQVIGITSAGAPVESNLNFALQAFYQYKNGSPVDTGRFPPTQRPKIEAAFAGQEWEGKKTNNFYNNLIRVIDPSQAQGVTVDMWMMRAFGYNTEQPGPAQYEFVENEVKRLAGELGWEPQQVQAAIWVTQKAQSEGTPVAEASFNYRDAIQKSLGQISWESIPGRTNDHFNEMFDAPYEQNQEYHVAISKALLDENGGDLVAKELEILSPGLFEAPGYFEGRVSPGAQTEIAAPKIPKAGTEDFATIQPEAEDKFKAYSAVIGTLLKQDGIGYHKPFFQKNIAKSKLNGMDIDIGRPLTEQETISLAEALENASNGIKDYNPISTPRGARIINFSYLDVPNIKFSKFVTDALNNVQFDNIENVIAGQFAASEGYLSNDWSKDKNGEGYFESIRGISSDLQGRVDSIIRKLQPRIDEVDQTFSEKYGWTRDDSINSEYRDRSELRQTVDLDQDMGDDKPPAPPGKPPSDNYEWTGGDELNSALALQTFLTKIQYKYDRQVVIEEVIEDQLGQGILKDLDLSVVDRLDLMKSIVGDQMVKQTEKAEKMIDDMHDAGGTNYADINEFLYALHAPERNKFIYEKRIAKLEEKKAEYGDNPSPQQRGQLTRLENLAKPFENNGSGLDTKAAIELLKKKYGIQYNESTGTAEALNKKGRDYLKVRELADNFIQDTINFYEERGLVEQEVLDDWNSRYKYYVPLSGFAGDTTVDGAPNNKGKGLSVYGLEIPKAKGRTSLAGDPIVQMFKQRENAVVRAEKNEVVKTLADQARTFQNPDVYEVVDKVPRDAKLRPEWDARRGSGFVFFKEDGVQKTVIIRDERLARAMQNLDYNGINSILATIGIATRMMSFLNTGANPDFIFPNFFRDLQAATAGALGEQDVKGGRIYGSNIAFKAVKGVLPRLGEIYMGTRGSGIKDPEQRKMFELYNELGSKTSYFEFLDVKSLTENFTSIADYRSGKISPKKFITSIIDYIGDINTIVENGIRFSQFTEFVRANGGVDNVSKVNARRAAVQAKNSSINFDRRGEWGDEIGSLLMFFNPAVQGVVQFMRGQNVFTKRGRKRLSKGKLGFSAGMATYGMLATLYNMFMTGEDDDGESIYSKIPDWEKNRNLIFLMPDAINYSGGELEIVKSGDIKEYRNGDTVWGIGIPQAYGYSMNYNLGRLFVETQAHKIMPEKFGKPLTSVEKAGFELADSFVQSFSPISPIDTNATGVEGLVSRSRAFLPSAVFRPAADIAMNENHFGGPITKNDFPFQPKTPGFTKAFRGTEDFYVDFTEQLNTLTGGNDYRAGWINFDPNQVKYFVDYHFGGAYRTLTRTIDLPRKIKEGDLTLEDIPIIRSVVVQPRTFTNASLFFDRKEEIEALAFEYKNLKGKDRSEFVKRENMPLVRLGDYRSTTVKKSLRKAGADTKSVIGRYMEDLKDLKDKEVTMMNLYKEKNPERYSKEMKKIDEERDKIYQRFNKLYNQRSQD